MYERSLLQATVACAVLALTFSPQPAHGDVLTIGFAHGVGNPGCLGGPDAFFSSGSPFTLVQECETQGQGPSFASGTVRPGSTTTTLSVALTTGFLNTGTSGVSWVAPYVVMGGSEPVRTRYRVDVHGTLLTSPCLARGCVALAEITSNSAHSLHRSYLARDGEDLDIAEQLTSGVFTAIPGIPFAVGWRLDAFASMSSGVGRAAVNFQNTVSFVEDGPVFDLPPGHSVSGPCVQDNLFVCGTDAPSPVALPASLLLVAAGLACVSGRAALGRRNERNRLQR